MALEMKTRCEECEEALAHDAAAFICSYECTFCAACAAEFEGTCPNCKGELVVRPVRRAEPREVRASTQYGATVHWSRGDAPFLDQRYSRGHTWRFDGGLSVRASASPHSVPVPMSDPAAVDPEEAFLAALSSCHMLWFLYFAAKRGVAVDEYSDEPYGWMVSAGHGRSAFAHIVLRPRVRFATGAECSDDDLSALHDEAHHACYLASALRYPLVLEPRRWPKP